MGSFCISCCATNQVIADDDKCMVVPIRQESTYHPVELTLGEKTFSRYGVANTTCHPGCFWGPVGGFISATYLDCGRVAPDDTPTNRRALFTLFIDLIQKAPRVAQGANPSHDVPFDIKNAIVTQAPGLAEALRATPRHTDINVAALEFAELTALWDCVWGVADECRLFSMDHRREPRPLQFAAFHQEAVDQLVGYTNKLTTWDDVPYDLASYVKHLLAQAEQNAEDAEMAPDIKRMWHRSLFDDAFKLGMSGNVQRVLLPFQYDIRQLLASHLDKGMPFDAFIEALRPKVTGSYVLQAMDCFNMKLSPIVYAGQDYRNSQGEAYAKFVSGVARAVATQRKEGYE